MTDGDGQVDLYDWLPGEEGRPTLNVSAAAAELGVTAATLRRWCELGHVRHARTPGGQRRFSRGELERVRRLMWDLGGGQPALAALPTPDSDAFDEKR